MTHLRIKNTNSTPEIVSNSIILKLYETALASEGNTVELEGNLLVTRCKDVAYNYLTGNLPDSNNKRFPNLSINATLGLYLNLDPAVESVLMGLSIGDGTGIMQSDLVNVNTVSNWFKLNTNLLNFNELFYLIKNLYNYDTFKN